jgi:phosphatidylinositol glycan class N
MLLPFVNGDRHRHEHSKMLALFLAGCPLFVLLSISTEGLFYAAYAAVLVLWLAVETAVRGPVEKAAEKAAEEGAVYRPKMEDVRIALFFLFFVQVGFFGTGKWVLRTSERV